MTLPRDPPVASLRSPQKSFYFSETRHRYPSNSVGASSYTHCWHAGEHIEWARLTCCGDQRKHVEVTHKHVSWTPSPLRHLKHTAVTLQTRCGYPPDPLRITPNGRGRGLSSVCRGDSRRDFRERRKGKIYRFFCPSNRFRYFSFLVPLW